jgi:hypothetical protein
VVYHSEVEEEKKEESNDACGCLDVPFAAFIEFLIPRPEAFYLSPTGFEEFLNAMHGMLD